MEYGAVMAADVPADADAFSRLAEEVDRLDSMIDRLENKLIPFLKPYSEAPEMAYPQIDDVVSPIRSTQRLLTRRIQRIVDITDRIDR